MVFAYEQQPWQTGLIQKTSEIFQRIKCVGYIHSSMNNFPGQFIKRAGSPEHLIVHGSEIGRVAVDLLGWKSDQVHLVPSYRYTKKINLDSDTVFLPYKFSNSALILKEISNLLNFVSLGSDCVHVKIHPIFTEDSKHLKLKQQIEKIIAGKNKIGHSKDRRVVIVVGVSTTLLEALEAGFEVYAVFEDPFFDAYNPEIWQELNCVRISDHSFRYSISNSDGFIKYPEKLGGISLKKQLDLIAKL